MENNIKNLKEECLKPLLEKLRLSKNTVACIELSFMDWMRILETFGGDGESLKEVNLCMDLFNKAGLDKAGIREIYKDWLIFYRKKEKECKMGKLRVQWHDQLTGDLV